MKKDKYNKEKNQVKNKPSIDSNKSLALRLNAKVFGHQFSAFLMINIILVIMTFVGSIVFMEHTASQIVEDIEAEYTSDNGYEDRSFANYDVTFSSTAPDDSKITETLRRIMPDNISDGQRKFSMNNSGKFTERLRSINYHVIVKTENDNMYMNVSSNIGVFYLYAFRCLIVLMIIQIFMLIDTALSMKKAIAKALEPLRELSQATQAFSDAASGPAGQYSPQALKNLASALDTVSGRHLDARIPADLMTEELKPLAAAINEMLNRINESYDSQVRFVSDASHELRTPIAVIQGYADLLSRWGTEDKDTLEESIQAIRSEAASMKQLVNQLLFLARGDSDSMKLNWEKLDLSAIVNEVIKEMDLIDKTHELISDIDPDVKIEGDSGLIKQLLRILTDNSLKYTTEGGRIIIKLKADNMARITVQDEGLGIPAEILPHIFDRFVRADESRTRNTGGSGLGLSIGKWITEKHGGYLEVISRENIGTRFTVVLPLIDERPKVTENKTEDRNEI